ncbi:hypothetical protein C9374_012963 [Naegleria lovaniensis]|uniref:U-box domain-containing protein n=1 Tax=Naegleria lovaniensis TaxID=51637 RepID=A0AA88G6J3_NAELO|nr:uncharacterized protein C9374_012963 [Naegleria lovaniensis]KAG2373020.1 hypothetical protein C9374_012963 [Naegleria lovaniensis]
MSDPNFCPSHNNFEEQHEEDLSDIPLSDLMELKTQCLEAKAASENKSNKPLVLVIGPTGAGKSVITNFLAGKKMRYEQIDQQMVVSVDGEAVTPIGHSLQSETQFSTFVDVGANVEYVLVDCAGFFDNRGDMEQLMATLSLRLSILNSPVKGVIVVMDAAYFTSRDTKLLETSQIIGKLLPNIEKLQSSIVYLINDKTNNYAINKTVISDQIGKHLENAMSRWNKLFNSTFNKLSQWRKGGDNASKSSADDEKDRLTFLQSMHDQIHNLFVVRFDETCLQEITEAINRMPGVDKSFFSLDDYDDKWNQLKELFLQITANACLVYENVSATHALTEKYQDDAKHYQDRINIYEKRLNEIGNSGTLERDDSQAVDRVLNQIIEEIKQNTNRLTSFGTELNQQKETLNRLEKQMKDLESPELVQVFSKTISEERMKFWGWLSYTDVNITFKLSNCPLVVAKEDFDSNTSRLDERNGHCVSSGCYDKRYVSKFGNDGLCEIVLKAQKNQIPDNKALYETVKQQRTHVLKEVERLEGNIRELTSDNERLKQEENGISLGKQGIAQKKKQMADEKRNLQSVINQFKNSSNDLKEKITKLTKQMESYEEKITSRQAIYYALFDILELLGLQNKFTEEFKKHYKNYSEKQWALGNDDSSENRDSEILEHLYCPISFELMIDPVVLPCCKKTIDRDSIFRAVDTSRKQQCPLCRQELTFDSLQSNSTVRDMVEHHQTTHFIHKISQTFLNSQPLEALQIKAEETENQIQQLEAQLTTKREVLEKIRFALASRTNNH